MKADASFLLLQSDIERVVSVVNKNNKALIDYTKKNDKKCSLLEERIIELEKCLS